MTQAASLEICGCLCAPMGHAHQRCEGFAQAGLSVRLTDRFTGHLVPACQACFEAVRRRAWKPRGEVRVRPLRGDHLRRRSAL